KKRKKKAGQTQSGAPRTATTPTTTEGGEAKGAKPKPKPVVAATDDKKKKGKPSRTVDTEGANLKMRETMQLMNTGGVGKKRQKRRKMKREEMAADREQQALVDEMEGAILEVTEYITVSD